MAWGFKKSNSLTITGAKHSSSFSPDVKTAICPLSCKGQRLAKERDSCGVKPLPLLGLWPAADPFSLKYKAQQPKYSQSCISSKANPGQGAVQRGKGTSPALALLPTKTLKGAGRIIDASFFSKFIMYSDQEEQEK